MKRAHSRPLVSALLATILGISTAALLRALFHLARYQRGT